MKSLKWYLGLFILIILGVSASVSIVPQADFGIQQQGKMRDFLEPGLHFHWPWASIKLVNGQTHLLSEDSSHKTLSVLVETFDKHQLQISYGLVWQIDNRELYFQAMTNKNVETILTNIVNQVLQEKVATQTVPEISTQLNADDILSQMLNSINEKLTSDGMKIVGLYISSIAVDTAERPLWIKQMRSEQDAQLENLRKQTATLSQELRNQTDLKIAQVLKDGATQAAKIRADGDLAATQIYADAYHQSPEFYQYFHHLQLYKKLLHDKQDVLILSSHTPFFQDFTQPTMNK